MVYQIVDADYAFSGATFADGDVIASGIKVANAVRGPGMGGNLKHITVTDTTDTGAALTLWVFDRFASFGVGDGTPIGLLLTLTRSAYSGTPTILDADAKAAILFHVAIAAGDYKDVGGAKVATVQLDRVVQGDDSGSIWIAIVAGGAITLTSGALKLRLGIDQEK